jgi:hypothetical protein
MKYCRFLMWLSLGLRTVAQPEADCVVVHRVSHMVAYSVPASSFPNKVNWHPEAEPFPVELGERFTAARDHLVRSKHLTNDLRSFSIRIRAPTILPHLSGLQQEMPKEMIGQQWVIIFEFYQQHPVPVEDGNELRPGPHERVVMLLDGTFAEEGHKDILSSTNASNWRRKAAEGSGILHEYQSEDPALATLSPNFKPPLVRWDPSTEPFPFTLNVQVCYAKQRLLKERHAPTSIRLREITIWPYHPQETENTTAATTRTNTRHWGLTFRFEGGSIHYYEAYMLLDGRILSTEQIDL